MEKKTGISGISMGKNAHKLYYPMKQAIMSILPIVDEFIVVLGDSDEDDLTRKEVESIASDKIKIIDTVWDIEKFTRGMEHAHQTDIAKDHCSGKWIFYLQSDEVIHEKYIEGIREKCAKYEDDPEVEGLLFDYVHFWGDYNHYQDNHCWYRKEIRIVKNDPEIHSWESAQSFRRIPKFDGKSYRQQVGTYKLKVVEANAEVFHYGWVRPPERMQKKIKAFKTNHTGKARVGQLEKEHKFDKLFDYGNLSFAKTFAGTHPAVMKEWIEDFNWENHLRYTGPAASQNPLKNKHDQFKYKAISWIEKYLLFGYRLGEFKNYILLK